MKSKIHEYKNKEMQTSIRKKIDDIKHVFFDLDRTLWDFEKNSETVIRALLIKHNIEKAYNTSANDFIKKYKKINHKLWHLYSRHKITKEELRSTRFSRTLERLGTKNNELGYLLEKEYIAQSPFQTTLLEGANDILDYLKPNYKLHILSNGFKEVQHIKLHQSGIKEHFNHIFISEEMGFQKPDKAIFMAAQTKAKANANNCIMIGDDFTNDIEGALNAGWKAVYLTPRKKRLKHKAMYQINSLVELKELL
ncbi:MAG: YjjG family noncanonical pyrimidine nucleotidase [Bacteroidia bacterium]